MTAIEIGAGSARAAILPERGALLTSLRLENEVGKTREILWRSSGFQFSGTGWPDGGMPICFPFAGRVWHEGRVSHYRVDKRIHVIPVHGFAFSLPWDIVQTGSSNEVALKLASSPNTKEMYPFDFELTIAYRLTSYKIDVSLLVVNTGSDLKPMPVALGLHPYFLLPEPWNHYALRVSAKDKIAVTAKGAAGSRVPLKDKEISLSQPEFHNLILGRHESAQCAIVDTRAKTSIIMRWQEPKLWNYLVLWSKREEFFCAEPWMAIPDAIHNNDGLIRLPPRKALRMHMSIELARGIALL